MEDLVSFFVNRDGEVLDFTGRVSDQLTQFILKLCGANHWD